MDMDTIKTHRHEYEEEWKNEFARRLQKLIEGRGIPIKTVVETMECDEERIHALLRGEDFPTVVELLRLCYLCYDSDDILFGAREQGFYYFLRGRFF